MTGASVAAAFLAVARSRPDLPFVIDRDDSVRTYAEVRAQARRVAAQLAAAGVGPGDRVMLSSANSAELVCWYLGVLLAGGVVVLVDHRARPEQLDLIRSDTGAAPGGLPLTVTGPAPPSSWLERNERAPHGDALIIYTSGTTGAPKGVVLSHANLRHTVGSIRQWARVSEGERELITLPLTHLFGLAHLHLHWSLAGSVVIDDGMRDIPRLLRRMAAHGVTCFAGTPAGFRLLLDGYADRFRAAAATLHYVVINSAPLPVSDANRLTALLPWVRCYTYYGLTEASRSTALHLQEHPGKVDTAGQPTPGCEILVGHPDTPLIGAEGEILVRGPHVTKRYWDGGAEDHLVLGWLRTGDLGFLDDEGFLTWTGRVSDQINVGGLKVSPAAVEAVLGRHESIADCVVAGVPSPVTGEQVVGFVVSHDHRSPALGIEIRRFCKPHLQPHEVPRRIEFVDEIPRTESGKVIRQVLLDRLGSRQSW